jgi:hypothetical protein
MTTIPVLTCKACPHVGVPKLAPGPSPYVVLARCANCGQHLKALPRLGWTPGRSAIDPPGSQRGGDAKP